MKKEYILLAVIFVLLLLYLAFHQSDNIHYQLPEISKIQPKTIDRLRSPDAFSGSFFSSGGANGLKSSTIIASYVPSKVQEFSPCRGFE